MAKRHDIDWDRIERVYRTGQFSLRELGERFDVAPSTIMRRAKKHDWVQDKSHEVKSRTKAALVAKDHGEPTPEDIEIAVKTNVEVIRKHRALLGRSMSIVEALLERIEDAIEEDGADIVGLSGTLQRVVTTLIRAIPSERQAFGLDEKEAPADETDFGDLSDEDLDERISKLLGKAGALETPARESAQE